MDIGGPDTQFAYPFDFFGEIPYKNVTLDYVMNFHALMPSRRIRDVMDPQAGPFCYTFDDVVHY